MERGRARGRASRPADRAALEAPPPAEPAPRWRFWPVLLSALAAFLAANLFVAGIGFSGAIPLRHLELLSPEQIGVLTAAQDLTLAVVLLVLLRLWPRLHAADLGLTRRPAVVTGLTAGAGLWALSIVVANAQAQVVGAHPQSLIVAAEANRSVPGLIIDVVSGGGVVAVVEELFFRATLFALLRQRLPFAYAAAASSALFAIAHEIAAWLPVFVLGIGLAYLYEKRQSLWTNALAHGTLNALSFLVLFFLPNLGA